MSLFSAVAIYFVLWWLSLFLVLPFGVRSQDEMGDVTPGTERAAPYKPFILRKVLATTLISAIIFAGVYVYFGVYGFSVEDLIW